MLGRLISVSFSEPGIHLQQYPRGNVDVAGDRQRLSHPTQVHIELIVTGWNAVNLPQGIITIAGNVYLHRPPTGVTGDKFKTDHTWLQRLVRQQVPSLRSPTR